MEFNKENFFARFAQKKHPAPHERAYWVEETRKMLGMDLKGRPYTFGRINGLTRDWKVEWIRDIYLEATHSKNPAKFWWWCRKESKLSTTDTNLSL